MQRRVLAVGPMPAEKCAYALARYSRSPDSIRDSLNWVRTHDSAKFLESFYFQYGHASIADLGHVVMCFEGISELAATEVEDEPLWDGQAKSSRYQNFSTSGFVTPPELDETQSQVYAQAARRLLEAYTEVHQGAFDYLSDSLPRPAEMKEEMYRRNIAARAYDVARYLLFLGIPTNIGQVTSIRTLEKQIRRLKASEYEEVRRLGDEIARACAETPECIWSEDAGLNGPVAPTLARHVDADQFLTESRRLLSCWARENLPRAANLTVEDVDLLKPECIAADITATLLYPVTDRPYRELYELAASWPEAKRREVMDIALGPRTRRDELLRGFRGGPYVYDIVMDIGAYRDMHRHRRCQQSRQNYTGRLGYDVPPLLEQAGVSEKYRAAVDHALAVSSSLPEPAGQYLLPFGARSRFLFKMDFAEAEYVSRLRSGVKGHFSYRNIAWKMKEKMDELEPELGRLIQATPPWIEDPLKR